MYSSQTCIWSWEWCWQNRQGSRKDDRDAGKPGPWDPWGQARTHVSPFPPASLPLPWWDLEGRWTPHPRAKHAPTQDFERHKEIQWEGAREAVSLAGCYPSPTSCARSETRSASGTEPSTSIDLLSRTAFETWCRTSLGTMLTRIHGGKGVLGRAPAA